MNYIGSKNRLSSQIIEEIKKSCGNISNYIFAEVFAGTGIVSRRISNYVKKVIANDFEYYSYVILRNYLTNSNNPDNTILINKLNNIKSLQGFIFNEYSSEGSAGRNYFTPENASKIDAIRTKIENWKRIKTIDESTYFYLLCALLESVDEIANTASVYGAYLKRIKRSASRPFLLKECLIENTVPGNEVYRQNANDLIKNIKGDILYLDPPYNSRQYGANYHLLNTIAEYKQFEPRGITGLPVYQKSDYCFKSRATGAIEELILHSDFEFIFLSYNNEGILPPETLKDILKQFGKYRLICFENYQRFKADKDSNRKYHSTRTTEFLHFLHKK